MEEQGEGKPKAPVVNGDFYCLCLHELCEGQNDAVISFGWLFRLILF